MRRLFLRMPYDIAMKRFTNAILACVFGLTLTAAAPIAASAASDPQVVSIDTTTAFSPSEITVHAGQPVELKFVGKGGVHGVESADLGIPSTTIVPGSTKTVNFTPKKAGTYTLHCTVPCGPNHAKMALVIKVVG